MMLLGGCGEAAAIESTSADAMLVGVLPYNALGTPCSLSPTRESVTVSMDDENTTHCSYGSGEFGEGIWASPHATKLPIPPRCHEGEMHNSHTALRFCRTLVEPNAFRPLTTDPDDASSFYATLKFGEHCPLHAIEIRKHIVNEDQNNKNQPILAGDLLYPNVVTDDARGNFTELVFCFFRAAPTAEETMSEFPDLGFPYAVFHDFEGQQPSFIIGKRWIYSDDSNQMDPARNWYDPNPENDSDAAAFLAIVENPRRDSNYDTCFDIGRVR
jgi:hypothetical protein